MEIINSIIVPGLNGARIAVYRRDHAVTPFIVCGVSAEGESMLECGFRAYVEVDEPLMVLSEFLGKVMARMGASFK